MLTYKNISLMVCALWVLPMTIACGNSGEAAYYANQLENQDPGTGGSTDDSNDTSGGGEVSNKVAICSELSLKNVAWPTALNDFSLNVFALAMNISGSFEGHTGWNNISDNFDGQGVSLGLFNQNFGQGSLQPLIINLRNSNVTKLKSFFTTAQYTSMASMLTKWEAAKGISSKAMPSVNFYQDDFSDLDDMDMIAEQEGMVFEKGSASNSMNQASVDWAVKNVYSGGKFISAWKTAFQNMAKSPEYVSFQVKAADAINKKAQGYLNTYKFSSMRAYLFFFDIVVQNGGISTTIKNQYLAWEKNNKSASETTKLKKLLEYRLTVVISQYRNDVKSRKTAIIDGKGTVHGSARNFPKEYCVSDWSIPYASTSLNLL